MKPASKNLRLGLFGQCSTQSCKATSHWKVLAPRFSSCAFCFFSPFEIERKITALRHLKENKKMQNRPVNHDEFLDRLKLYNVRLMEDATCFVNLTSQIFWGMKYWRLKDE